MITRYDIVDGSMEIRPDGKYVEYSALVFVLETLLRTNPSLQNLRFVLFQLSVEEGLNLLKQYDEVYSVIDRAIDQYHLRNIESK